MKKMMDNYSGKLQQLLCLLICVLMVVAVSIRRDGKVAGRYVNQQQTVSPKTEPMAVLEDGSVQLNTTELGKDIVGYGGIVPLEITLQDGRVKSIRALANSESPDFFKEASALLSKWNGKTIEDAQKMKVDAVSGATFSSKAIAGLIVVLMAAIVPLFIKNRLYRIAQQILNVIVLGILVRFFSELYINHQLYVKWHERSGIDSAGHHANHGIRISSLRQEIILLYACVSLRFFAGTCREMRRI